MAIATAARSPERCSAVISESAQAYLDARIVEGVRIESTAPRTMGLERLALYHGGQAEWVLDAWAGTWTDPAFGGWSLRTDLAAIRCRPSSSMGTKTNTPRRAIPSSCTA